MTSTLKVFGQRVAIMLALVGGFYLTLHSVQYSTWHKERLYRQLLRGNPQEKLMAASALAHFGAEEQLLAGLKTDIPEVRHLSREALEYLWFREAGNRAHQTLEDAFKASEKEDFKTALCLLDKLVQKYPRYAEAWNRRASVFWQMGKYEQSISDCEKALALNPNHYGAWQGIGVCRVQLGDIAEACRCLRAALKISPFDETTRHCLEKCEELLRVMKGKGGAPAGEMI